MLRRGHRSLYVTEALKEEIGSNTRSFFVMCSSAVLLVSSALSDHSALAQSGRTAESAKTNDDNRTAQELLTEVRLLRKTLQRTGLNAYRSQLIVEGIRAQNDKV